jgi:hypothetical protein
MPPFCWSNGVWSLKGYAASEVQVLVSHLHPNIWTIRPLQVQNADDELGLFAAHQTARQVRFRQGLWHGDYADLRREPVALSVIGSSRKTGDEDPNVIV